MTAAYKIAVKNALFFAMALLTIAAHPPTYKPPPSTPPTYPPLEKKKLEEQPPPRIDPHPVNTPPPRPNPIQGLRPIRHEAPPPISQQDMGHFMTHPMPPQNPPGQSATRPEKSTIER